MRSTCIAIVFIVASFTSILRAQVPQLVNYQGRVAVGSVNFSGSGQFKFALVNAAGSTTYWSNDGTSAAGSQPTNAVTLTVTNGLYSVLLGDATVANMTAIPNAVFNNADVRLRVWFNDGSNGFQLLTPDQRIASVGYAMVAGGLSNGAITSSMIAPGAVGSAQLGTGLTLSGVTTGSFSGSLAGTANFASLFTGNLAGDVTGTQSATVVANVGGLSATGVASGANLANAATNSNTPGTIVKRDASGNFSAGAVTADSLTVSTSFVVEPRPASTGSFNNFIGANAGNANVAGTGNTFVGHNSGKANISGGSNSFFGLNAGQGNISGQLNVFVGQGAGAFNQSGSNNTFVGQGAGFNNTADGNSFFGYHAGLTNTSATGNAFFGVSAGELNTASNNSFFGSGAGAKNVSGTQNSFFGISAGNLTTGSFNSFFGAGAGQTTAAGVGNTFVGNIAGNGNTAGSNNTFLGASTGASMTTESHNLLVGDAADGTAGITNSTAIGPNAKVTTSNSLVLGSINGINGATNGTNVGIGVTAPSSTLSVNGSLAVKIRSTSSAISILDSSDCVFVFTGSTANSGGNLPTAVGIAGRTYYIKNRGSVAFLLFTILNQTIDGVNYTSSALSIPTNSVVHLVSDGTNWIKIN